jgi:VWFA-related protein
MKASWKPLASLVACGAAAGSLGLAAQQAPTFRSRTDVVTVDVHVVDAAGQPVSDLRPEDFTVTVDGQPRRAAVADMVWYRSRDAAGATAAGATRPNRASADAPASDPSLSSRPPAPGRLVLFVVDEANIRAGAARFAAEAAAAFLEGAGPADRIGQLGIPDSSVRVEPTTDRAPVRQALRRVAGHRVSVETQLGAQYSVGLSEAFMLFHDRRGFGQVLTRECMEKAPGASVPSQQCAADVEMLARALVNDARQRMLSSARALTAVLEALAAVEGPKTLIVLSEELPVADFLAERKDFEAETARISTAAARAQASVYVLQLHAPEFDVEDRMHPASAGGDAAVRASGLETVTTLTGGRRLMVSGRAEPALERIARETSAFYVVGFEAQAADRDGRPHVVGVKVNRAGVDVRARREFVFTERTQKALTDAAAGAPKAAPVPPPPSAPGAAIATAAAAPPTRAPSAPPAGPAPASGPIAPPRSVDELLARAGRYVVEYGEQMSIVIAVERYGQWMTSSDASRAVTRQLVSEFALVRVKDDWVGLRDVLEMDGTPVPDRRDRLQKLLIDRSPSTLDQGRKIADESARLNLGGIQRNFNVPTTALFFLHPSNQKRFRYKQAGQERVAGIDTVKLTYEEHQRPTIVRTSAGRDMPLQGTFWIDPLTGRVLRTHMELTSRLKIGSENRPVDDPMRSTDTMARTAQKNLDPPSSRQVDSTASISVTYRPDARLGLLVPDEMRETYEGAWTRRTTNEEALTKINCVATYSDFKRFETGGRVVEPKR